MAARLIASRLTQMSSYRYDGLYRVYNAELVTGKSGFNVCRFELRVRRPFLLCPEYYSCSDSVSPDKRPFLYRQGCSECKIIRAPLATGTSLTPAPPLAPPQVVPHNERRAAEIAVRVVHPGFLSNMKGALRNQRDICHPVSVSIVSSSPFSQL